VLSIIGCADCAGVTRSTSTPIEPTKSSAEVACIVGIGESSALAADAVAVGVAIGVGVRIGVVVGFAVTDDAAVGDAVGFGDEVAFVELTAGVGVGVAFA
jgi:hypothetical protein